MKTYHTRADLLRLGHPAFRHLTPDSSGNPCVWLNHYECECDDPEPITVEYWTDDWSCQCNDRCPACNTETQPTTSEWLGLDDPEARALWERLPDAGY